MPTRKKGTSKNSAKAKQSLEQVLSKDTCFTIMPFGSWFDYYYEMIYVPAIKATKLIPRRADDLYRPSAIVNDIWTMTQAAKVILADLSGKNPNVFYELGLAHALTKPAILVTESMEDIPFDLRSLRVIVYDKNEPKWGEVLQQKIETAINEILASPLDAVLPTFLKVKESTSRKTVSKEEKDLISLRQDMDLIKHQIQTLSPRPTRVPRKDLITHFDQAVKFARSYLNLGIPNEEIISLLLTQGVPSNMDAELVLEDAKKASKSRKVATSEGASEEGDK